MVRQHVRAQGAEVETHAAAGTGLQPLEGSAAGAAAGAAFSAQAGTASGSRKHLSSRSTSASDLGQPLDLTLSMASSGSVKYHAMQGSGELWTDEERRAYLTSLHIVDLPGEEAVLRFLNDAMAGSPLPSPWKLKRDKHGHVYFANQPADVVTWSHPLEPSLRELAGAFRVCLTLTPELRKTCIYALHETWEQEAKKQFSKWYSIRHESGRAYYCHRDTGDTMWEHPAEVVLPAHYLKLTSIEWLLDEAYVANTCAPQSIIPVAAGENVRNMSEITLKPEGGAPSELDLIRRDLEQQLQKAVENQRLLKRELTAAEVELRAARASTEASRRDASRAQGAQRMRRNLVSQLAALDDEGEAGGVSTQAESNTDLPPDAKGVLAAVHEVLVARERDMAKRLEDEATLQATLSRERDAHARLGQAHLELAAERAAERKLLQGRLRESDASNEELQEMLSKSTADLRNHTEYAEEMASQQQSLEQKLKEAVTSKEELQEELLKSTSVIAPIEEEPSNETSKLITESELPCIKHALSCLQDAEIAITTLEERLAQAEESSRQKEAALRAECNECARQLQERDDTKAVASPVNRKQESSGKAELSTRQEPTEKDPRLVAQQVLESASASETLARLLKGRRQSTSEEPPLPPAEAQEEGPALKLTLEESEDPCLVKAVASTSVAGNVAPDREDQELRGHALKATDELHAATLPDDMLGEDMMEAPVKELAAAEDAFAEAEPQECHGALAQSLERLQEEHAGNSIAAAAETEQRLAEENRLAAHARDRCAEMSSDIEKAKQTAAQSVAARNDVQQQLAAAQERLKARELALSQEIERRTVTLQSELSEHHLRQEELKHQHEALQSRQQSLSSELQNAASLRTELQQRLRSADIELLKAHAQDVMGSSEAVSAAASQRRDEEAAETRTAITADGLRNSAVHGRMPFQAAGSGEMTIYPVMRQGSATCSWITEEQDGSLISALTPPRSTSRASSDKEARRARRALEDAIVLASRIQLLHAESMRTQRKIRVAQGHVQALSGTRARDESQQSTGGYPASAGKLASATPAPPEALPVSTLQDVHDAGLPRMPPGPCSTVTSISATPEASVKTFMAVLETQAAVAVRARLMAAKEELLRLNASLHREVAALAS